MSTQHARPWPAIDVAELRYGLAFGSSVEEIADFNRRFYPFNAFRSLLGIAGDVKAPTYAELYSGDWTHPTCSGCMS
jgi:hypothetical protein